MNPTLIENACKHAITALATSTTPPAPRGGDGGSPSGGQSKPPLPWGILDAKVELKHKASSWALLVSEEGGFVPLYDDDAVSILGWLASKADWIAGHDAAEEFVDEISESARTIEAPYRPRTPKFYVGDHQGQAVHVREGQQLVELADGTVERLESVKAWNRDQARLHEGTAKEVSEIVWEFFGEYIKPRKISITRDHDADPRYKATQPLTPIRKDGRNHVYRVQDILTRFEIA